jgi:hypothetical protein
MFGVVIMVSTIYLSALVIAVMSHLERCYRSCSCS